MVPHRIIRSRYTGRCWVSCYVWYSEEGTGRAAAPPSPLLAVPNVTAHPSTASVGPYQLLYCYNDGPLLCGFNVAIKGLSLSSKFRFNSFCRAMLCISAVYAGMRCLSVCLSVTFVDHVKTNKNIFEIFSTSGSHTILVFSTPNAVAIIPRETP